MAAESTVMAGLVPAIHVFGRAGKKDVDARDKHGHDDNLESGDRNKKQHERKPTDAV
jgi:hypothetical protein